MTVGNPTRGAGWKARGAPGFGGRGGRPRRAIGDRIVGLAPETTARWVAFCDVALAAAKEPTEVRPAEALERERHPETGVGRLARPGGSLAGRALSALIAQTDLFLAALPRERAEFAPVLKAVAEQAWRLVTPGAPGDVRHPSVGRD